MKEIKLSAAQQALLADIYANLQKEYEQLAARLDFTCRGCPDNCCDSYFLHHTYAEWAYLWDGVRQLPEAEQKEIEAKAKDYLLNSKKALQQGKRPQLMCPLNLDGLCRLYEHRLLVCRTHGVPAAMTRPDGHTLEFPGCFRCQEIVAKLEDGKSAGRVERTPHLGRLVMLEKDLFAGKRHLAPKVKMTIAEMLVKGPPSLPTPFCERGCGTDC